MELSQQELDAKQHAQIAYVLMLLGLFTGLLWFVGAIWAMLKIGDARGTRFEDHYSNIIRVFIIGIILTVVGGILTIVLVGWFILLGVFIWSVFKLVKGLLRVSENQSYKAIVG
ncbi:hypothetical protein OCL06_01600 [Alteromonas sp. ASW11-19]|uniref:DUF4870 domain-containing protein n=1 Tax=Alteromonas salexigens TaxID=2982530 RepID=A0ABT2VM02_9ALTE|nr:DUF4870 domain-containing protein [Alteromonas salexigens]MCU7553286.1 hypothetical protein [Alteromonas salexigens]